MDQKVSQSSMCVWLPTLLHTCVLTEEKVAFSAMLKDGGQFGPFNTDITLKFTKVLGNTGKAYNPATGHLLHK